MVWVTCHTELSYGVGHVQARVTAAPPRYPRYLPTRVLGGHVDASSPPDFLAPALTRSRPNPSFECCSGGLGVAPLRSPLRPVAALRSPCAPYALSRSLHPFALLTPFRAQAAGGRGRDGGAGRAQVGGAPTCRVT
eukprot:2285497-Rhodomonas_salina.3